MSRMSLEPDTNSNEKGHLKITKTLDQYLHFEYNRNEDKMEMRKSKHYSLNLHD